LKNSGCYLKRISKKRETLREINEAVFREAEMRRERKLSVNVCLSLYQKITNV